MFIIVTAVKDRSEHLDQSIEETSKSSVHDCHLIIDYGSSPSYSTSVKDSRIKVVRVNPQHGWSLPLAYNIGFSIVNNGDVVLKQDADIYLKENEYCYVKNYLNRKTIMRFRNIGFGETKIKNGSSGMFAFIKEFDVVKFNPYIKYWGWDDLDIYKRVQAGGWGVLYLDGKINPTEIMHSDSLRKSDYKLRSISASNLINSIVSDLIDEDDFLSLNCGDFDIISIAERKIIERRVKIIESLPLFKAFHIIYLHYRGLDYSRLKSGCFSLMVLPQLCQAKQVDIFANYY